MFKGVTKRLAAVGTWLAGLVASPSTAGLPPIVNLRGTYTPTVALSGAATSPALRAAYTPNVALRGSYAPQSLSGTSRPLVSLSGRQG
jgi:hypothetical protein